MNLMRVKLRDELFWFHKKKGEGNNENNKNLFDGCNIKCFDV